MVKQNAFDKLINIFQPTPQSIKSHCLSIDLIVLMFLTIDGHKLLPRVIIKEGLGKRKKVGFHWCKLQPLPVNQDKIFRLYQIPAMNICMAQEKWYFRILERNCCLLKLIYPLDKSICIGQQHFF